jgi:AcrR family transcriptional regulator
MEKFLSLPEEKQNIIINAAFTAFGNNGYKKTSVNDIATAAGISKSMIFHYFGTKKDLYLYLINLCGNIVINEMNDKFDKSVTDFFDRIILASDIKVAAIKRYPAAISFLTSVYYEESEEVKDDITTILSQSKDIRNKIAFDGTDLSKFKDGIDPYLVFKMLLWLTEGFMSASKDKAGIDIEVVCEEIYACMRLIKNNFYKEEYLDSVK